MAINQRKFSTPLGMLDSYFVVPFIVLSLRKWLYYEEILFSDLVIYLLMC